MTTHRLWVRALRIAVAAAVFLVLGVALFVNLQQLILRWRAGQLLADIRAIQMGHSTWDDAQRLMHRWGPWGKWEGSCTSQSCDYQIVLQDISHAYPAYFTTKNGIQERTQAHQYSFWQRRLYSILGGRFSQVYVDIKVKNGIIWTKAYDLGVSMYPRFPTREDFQGYMLFAESEGVTHFRPDQDWRQIGRHPEYIVQSETACSGCKFISVELTPLADVSVRQISLDFNLNCLTRWTPCEAPSEIMPSAWHLHRLEEKNQQTASHRWQECGYPLEIVGRDYRFALLTEAASMRSFQEPGFTRYVASLRSLESLKNGAYQRPENLKDVRLGWTDTVLAGGDRPTDVKQGDRIIFFFEAPFEEERDVVDSGIGPCSFVLDNAQNRAAVEKGIAADGLSTHP